MNKRFFLYYLLLSGCNEVKDTIPSVQINNEYHLVTSWPALDTNIKLGNPTGIGIDTSQHVLVFHRADRKWPLTGAMPSSFITSNTVLVLDNETGKTINSWGSNMFIMPHGLTVDDQNNVWLTDVGLHQIFKFTIDGKLLLKLGEPNVPGNDSLHFNLPTDVAVAKDGSFYVSDGYGNSRIVKFSAEGKYLFEWGTKGNNKCEFDTPHGITIDNKSNIYIADRENNRVQVFDSAGKFISELNDKSLGRICGVTYDGINDKIIAVDDLTSLLNTKHHGSDIIIFNREGIIQSRFGRSGNYQGPIGWYHDVAIDKKGNIYAGDILNNSLVKFSRDSK